MGRSVVVACFVVAGMSASVATVACVSDPALTTANDPPDASAAEGSTADASDGADGGAQPAEDAPVDDPAVLACAASCPPAGGTCMGATCMFTCPGALDCNAVSCPPGVACQVTCTGKESCGSIECGTASSCRITCTGEQACKRVRSGAAQTDIVCDGKDACKDTGCAGTTCGVTCTNEACKALEVRCCATTQCTVNGLPGVCR